MPAKKTELKQAELFSDNKVQMKRDAVVSDDGKYRYQLSRIWDATKIKCCFVMLNPSTADHDIDDPTVRKCIGFARQWQCGGIYIVNVFPYRATDPREILKLSRDELRGDRQKFFYYLIDAVQHSEFIICAWGNHGQHLLSSSWILGQLDGVERPKYHLGFTKVGEPNHPLYLPYSTERKYWTVKNYGTDRPETN